MNLKLERIRKSYGRKKVLQGIDMELSQGIYGFLGANGVGKTTLFKIISGYTRDYQGSVSYPKCKKGEVLLGVLPQNFIGYPTMTVREFLTYMANMKTEASKQDVRMEIEEKWSCILCFTALPSIYWNWTISPSISLWMEA